VKVVRRRTLLVGGALVVAASLGLAACGGSKTIVTGQTTTTSSRSGDLHDAATVTSPGAINPAAIPLGDGYVSTTPKVGYVDSCVTRFGGIGGAQVIGPWVNTKDKTWDSLTKIHVEGSVSWPNASAASGNVCALYQLTQCFVLSVAVAPGDVATDHRVLLLV